MSNKKATLNLSSDLSFPSVLFLVFLVLKLTNVIDWSWWWVTAPLWIPILVAILIMAPILYLIGKTPKHK
jgi:hypothetical protein